MTRDSYVLWIGFAVAIVGYLATAEKPPTDWTYLQWLQGLSVVLAWISGKLASSPLKGKHD
mgnify:FL=1